MPIFGGTNKLISGPKQGLACGLGVETVDPSSGEVILVTCGYPGEGCAYRALTGDSRVYYEQVKCPEECPFFKGKEV